jgi:hypothetical protein
MKAKKKVTYIEEGQETPPPTADQGGDTACQDDVEIISAQPNMTNIWQNPKAVKLISWLLNEKNARINPEISLQNKEGFLYPKADDIMDTSGITTSLILESLVTEGVLLRDDYEKILLSPDGSVQLIPVERCPNCNSAHLSKGKMIEHFLCGHVGLEEEFISGLKSVCPKCKKELKLIGTDYRVPGLRYTCHNCHGIFPLPTIKYRCLKTDEIYDLEELRHVWLYSYRLNEARRKRLEFELEPKKRFVDYLHSLGYDVQEAVRLQGKSGAKHTIDLLARMEDPIAKHTVAVGILAAQPNEEAVTIDSLFSFDSKIYDIGINHKIVLAIPRLASEAVKFADRQGIRVYGIEELGSLLARQSELPEIVSENREQPSTGPVDYESESELVKLGPKGYLKRLLEKKGYTVTENAKIIGRSGAEHVLELYAQKDDGITSHQLAARVLTDGHTDANGVNEVVQFDTAAYDAGIADKVIITIPKLGKAAKQFANYQHIKVLEVKDLIDFSSKCFTPKSESTTVPGE